MDEITLKKQEQQQIQKTEQERLAEIDQSLKQQKDRLYEMTKDADKQDEFRFASKQKMEIINKEITDDLKKKYGVTMAVSTRKTELKQDVPAAKYWWWSRHSEENALKKAKQKYGAHITVNSLREQKAMQQYEEIREAQQDQYSDHAYFLEDDISVDKKKLNASNLFFDVQIDGYDRIAERLKRVENKYSRRQEINNGLKAFFGMQKTSWFFWKKTIGALGTETLEEERDAKSYNKKLLDDYTKSAAGSEKRKKVLDHLRRKIMNFEIKPKMLTDGYLADNSATLRRFVEMTKGFRILIATNPGYLEELPEEERIMLGNTINYTGPLIEEFLTKHQAYKHLEKKRKKTVLMEHADEDFSARNEQLMKDTWKKLQQADVAEQTAIGLKNKKVVAHLDRLEETAKKRRKEEAKHQKLPDYAIVLKYDTTGEREAHLLNVQDQIRKNADVYELFGKDMEKLFERFARSLITWDTLDARIDALKDAMEETRRQEVKQGPDRRYSAFLEYAENEKRNLEHDKDLMLAQAKQYRKAVDYVCNIHISEDDITLPKMKEKDAEEIQKVLQTEDLSFLLHLEDCRFYAKEFTEISGGKFQFKEVMKDAISRARSQEMKVHADKLEALETKFGKHQLETYQILALKPEDLQKYNFDGYTDEKGVRHHGAHDLMDEVNFKHMKEIASIANMDLEKAKEHLRQVCEESGNTPEETEKRMLDLETKYALFKDYGKKWEGTYAGLKTEAYKYLPQIPDMEGKNGVFQDPHVFQTYKENLQKKLEEKEKNEPDSPDISRYRDMIALMDAMLIRSGLLFEGDEDIKLLNAEAYQARYQQVKYQKRLNKALSAIMKNGKNAKDRDRLLKRADDALFFQDKYAELEKHYGKGLGNNLLQGMMDRSIEKAETEEEKEEALNAFYANLGVTVLEFRNKLTPEFFTEDYIRNNFDEFARTILTIRDFGRMIKNEDDFNRMMEGISEENKDVVGEAADVLLHLSGRLSILLFTVFGANNVNPENGQVFSSYNLVKMELQVLPENELSQEYQKISETLKAQKKAKEDEEAAGNKRAYTIQEIKEQTELARRGMDLVGEAAEFDSELAEDFLDHNLTIQLQKLRDLDTLIGSEKKKALFEGKSPTEELYQFLYSDKESKDLSFAGDKEVWKRALRKAEGKTGGRFKAGLTKEARDVAKAMQEDPQKIEDYLQWKVRQDSRVYMNERSKMLGVKEAQEDTNVALEIMDSIEETHSAVHNTINQKLRFTLFPELEKQGIDPEQFMHLLRIVHRNSSGMAGRMVDITNQSANMDKTTRYMDPSSKGDFIRQVTSEVMKFEITENMLSEEYLKEPGNFRYMYFMAQKLKAYEQLYMKDKKSVEEALEEHENLLQKVNERFGTFYGNLSDQVYRMVLNFAAKYGVDQNGARTFGLSAEEYEKLTEEMKTKDFAAKSQKNMANAKVQFQENASEIKNRYAQHRTAVATVNALQRYKAFEVENWLKQKPEQTEFVYKAAGMEQQVKDNRLVVSGMENAITLKEDETKRSKTARKTVKKLDNRFRIGDVAYLLPEQSYRKDMKKNWTFGERSKGIQDLTDLFSGNAVRQMNYLLSDGHLDGILELFKKNQKISVSSKVDLSSEDYLTKNFSEELFVDAKKMAVYALLPTIIPNLFEDAFLKEAGVSVETVQASEAYAQLTENIETFQEQSESISTNTRQLSSAGKITERDKAEAEDLVSRLDRQVKFAEEDRERLLPKLKTKAEKSKVKSQLKELKKFIGSTAQREFYKNFANHLQRYARVCGVNTESPDNSLGSFVSGMTQEKINVTVEAMKSDFADSQEALKKSMK